MHASATTKLEINDNIIKKQLLLNEPQDGLDTLFPSNAPFSSAVVKPKPGICVKTKNTANGEKVFINVCVSEAVPAPEDLSAEELIAIFESDAPSDFKIPMSIGPPHPEADKSGKACTAYDVIINPSFLEKMSENPLFHNFFMIVTIEGLDQKYDVSLDKNCWTELKNKKYYGPLPEQAIRTSLPLIQELSGVKRWCPEDFPDKTLPLQEEGGASAPESPLITEVTSKKIQESSEPPREGKKKARFRVEKGNASDLRFEVAMPEMVNAEGMKVGIGGDRVVVESDQYFVEECLPYALHGEESRAFFVKDTRTLVLVIPTIEVS